VIPAEMTIDLNALNKTTEELLCNRRVFDVDSFGWLNEEDEDPEYIGYVMWALSPPYEHDFESWQNKTPPNREPTEAGQRLMELGHDFFGLMKTARHFIGLALVHQPAVRPIRFEPTEFDFNEFAALVALTAAADRLSDFIIVTALGKKENEEGERNKACDKLRDSGLRVEADALQEGFKAIGKAREARNKAAHGLATRPAHVQRALIAADREAFEKQRGLAASNRKMPDEDVEARAELLCDCYQWLVKMGEVSFRTEHNWRHAPLSRTVI
jgi:hypothetical protein